MEIKKLDEFVQLAKAGKTKRLVVAAAADAHVLEAVYNAQNQGIIEPILVGDKEAINQICTKLNLDFSGVEIINEADPFKASSIAVSLIREDKADILMKGYVATAQLLKAVLDKEKGLRKGALISHIAFLEIPTYHKILAIADAGVNIAPEFEDKLAIIENSIEAFHKLGIDCPKVALAAAVETVNPKMKETVHAAMLTQMNRRKQIKGCIIDGPLAIDNIVSKEAAQHKGISSEVAGDADLMVCPDLASANGIYKTIVFLANACSAAVLMGAKVPIVLTSRADSDKSKLMSIALAAAMN